MLVSDLKKRWPRTRPKDYGCGTSSRRHIFIGGRFLRGGKTSCRLILGSLATVVSIGLKSIPVRADLKYFKCENKKVFVGPLFN